MNSSSRLETYMMAVMRFLLLAHREFIVTVRFCDVQVADSVVLLRLSTVTYVQHWMAAL